MKSIIRKGIALLSMAAIMTAAGMPAVVSAEDNGYIDNSSLLPAYVPDDQVELLDDGSPEWMRSLIMSQFRIETVTEEGTFQSAISVLDHFAEMGVNGLWINPIYKRQYDTAQRENNGYGNWGPNTVEPTLTGTEDLEESYAVIKEFVDAAHERNIRIFFDIIVWGTSKDSPIVTEHPEFYTKDANGNLTEAWGGWVWNWNSPELRAFFTDAAVNLIMKTGADGFRVDLAPDTSGYYFEEVKQACLEKGRKIMVMSEGPSQHRESFDLDQSSVGWGPERMPWEDPEALAELKAKYGHHGEAFMNNNIVDCIKTGYLIGEHTMQSLGMGGTLRFYTFNLLNHDDNVPNVRGSRVKFAYQAIFSPFIPIWWVGEEWMNPGSKLYPGVMYYAEIEWDKLDQPRNRAFYEDVKKYIRIRRENPEIFEYFPEQLIHTNIEKVNSEMVGWGANTLQAYARYQKNKAVVIVPNNEDEDGTFKITPDYEKIGLGDATGYRITDLYADQVIAEGTAEELASFETTISAVNLGIYQIEAIDANGNVSAPGTFGDDGANTDSTDGNTSAPEDSSSTSAGTDDAKTADNTVLIVVIVIAAVILVTLVFCIVMIEYGKRRNAGK